jgi:hypothetical protein
MRTTDPTPLSKLLTVVAIALEILLGVVTHSAGVDRGFGLVPL